MITRDLDYQLHDITGADFENSPQTLSANKKRDEFSI